MQNYSIKKSFTYVNGFSEVTAYYHTEVFGSKVVSVNDIERHKSCRCWILTTEDGNTYLQSYNTIVSRVDRKNMEIYETKHSVTTSRQQHWFANEFMGYKRINVEAL